MGWCETSEIACGLKLDPLKIQREGLPAGIDFKLGWRSINRNRMHE
jgi:hypothetical protein